MASKKNNIIESPTTNINKGRVNKIQKPEGINVNEANSQNLNDTNLKDITYYRARVDDKYWYSIKHDDILDIGDNPIPKRSAYFFVKSFK